MLRLYARDRPGANYYPVNNTNSKYNKSYQNIYTCRSLFQEMGKVVIVMGAKTILCKTIKKSST